MNDDVVDEVVAEVRAARKKICEECDYDFEKLTARYMRLQAEHPELLVREVPKADAAPTVSENP
jgi:hypothetical protein